MSATSITVRLIDETRNGFNRIQNQLGEIDNRGRKTQKTFDGLKTAAIGFVSALGVNELLRFGTSVQQLNNRLALLPDSFGDAATNLDRIRRIANNTQQPIDATADLFQKIARTSEQYGLSAGAVSEVTETFANILRLAGADAAAADGAIRQLGQALGSGAFRGDEFNSVVEATAGEILPLLAEELGVSAGQVRELASEGKITADVLLNALGKNADEVRSRVSNLDVTIGGAITALQNNLAVLGSEAAPVFAAIADGILVVANNLVEVTVAAGTFVATLAAAKLASIVTGVGGIAKAFATLSAVVRANPVVAIATALATVAFTIADNWSTLTDFFERFTTNVAIKFNELKLSVLEALDATPFFDFADGIASTEGDLVNLRKRLKDLNNQQSRNERTVQKAITTNEGFNTVVSDQTTNTKELEQAIADANAAIDDNINKIVTDTNALSLNQTQRDTVNSIIQNENQLRKSLGTTVAQLSQEEIQAIQRSVQNENFANANFLKLNEEKISAIVANQKAHSVATQQIAQNEKKQREAEQATLDFTQQTNELIKQNYQETTSQIQQLEDSKQLYIQNAREQGRLNNEETQLAIQEFDRQIAEERKAINDDLIRDIKQKANQYREDELSAFALYNRQRLELDAKLAEGAQITEKDKLDYLRKINKEYVDGVTTEYDDLYRYFDGQIKDFLDVNREQYGLLEEIVQLTFGVNITDIIKESFATMLGTVVGFKGDTENELFSIQSIFGDLFGGGDGEGTLLDGVKGFAEKAITSMGNFAKNGISSIGDLAKDGLGLLTTFGENVFGLFGNIGDFIANIFSNVSLNGIVDFVKDGLDLFSGFGGSVTKLLGGVGNFILDNFSSLFNSIQGGASSLIDVVGNIFGGGGGGGGGSSFSDIAGAVANFIPGLGPVVGGAISFIGDIFGFAKGGVFAGGKVTPFASGGVIGAPTVFGMQNGLGLMGEAGPEAILPLSRTSTGDLGVQTTGSSQPVTVNFNIQALDSTGFEMMILNNRDFITDSIRDAVQERGSILY